MNSSNSTGDMIKHNYIVFLRLLACFAVILLHYSNSYNYRIDVPTFDGGIFLFCFTRWCVPVFVMITGALLLSKETTSIQEFYKKRFSRILLPFLFWSLVYIIYQRGSDIPSLKEFIRIIFVDGAYWHFWYVYMIVGLVLFVPYLSAWAARKDLPSMYVFLILWLLFSLSTITLPQYATQFDLTFFGNFVGYLILGYFLHVKTKWKYDWLLGLALYIAGGAYTFIVTLNVSYANGQMTEFLANYKSWNVIVMSAGVFLFFKSIQYPEGLIRRIDKISALSFGIYLVHILIRDTIVKENLSFLNVEPYSYLLFKTVLVLLLSFVLVWNVHQIPRIGKYISG